MNATLISLSGFAGAWAQVMLRASWQGALALTLAWALCHTLARRSGRAQSWIWRLAYLKFAACLLLLAPLNLPLLPAPSRSTIPTPAFAIAPPPPGVTDLPQQTRASSPRLATQPPIAPPSIPSTISPALSLLIAWSIGTLAILLHYARGYRDSHGLRQTASRVTNKNFLALYSDLAQKFHLRHPPALLSTPSPLAPALTGLLRPAILLPESLLSTTAPERLSLILAHELAHARRRDLLWNHFHSAITALFFFHPLLWLASRPVRFAQELACDQLTLARTRASSADYAGTLLDVLTLQNHLRHAPMSVGVVDSASPMRRRLQAMTKFTPWSKSRLITTAACLAFIAALGLVPWRLVAQTNPPTAQPPAVSTTAPAPFNATIHAGSATFTNGVTITTANSTISAEKVELNSPVTLTTPAPSATHAPPSPPSSISFPAQIHAPTATLRPPVAGTLTEILARPGQQVKKGDILFKLDNHAAAAQVAKDKALLTVAEEKLKTADIQKRQVEMGIIPPGGATSIEQAQAEIEAQNATLQADQATFDAASIRAPFDGTLANFELAPGVFVAQGASLATLVNTADLSAVFNAAAPYDIRPGQKIAFHLIRADFPGSATKAFPGEVDYVSPNMDASTDTYQVSAHLTGDTSGLKPGAIGEAILK